MSKKVGYIIATWIMMILVYVILAASMPALNSITASSATEMQSSSNMSNYPGTLEVVQSSPVWLWMIPGGIGVVATAVFLKRRDT